MTLLKQCVGFLSASSSTQAELCIQKRHLWRWLSSVFNRLDKDRIKEVGPDRACAEWLLRCGAHVKWVNFDKWTRDYNLLPTPGPGKLKIEAIDATESSIMALGFPHLRGCKHVQKMILHKCGYLDDGALPHLELVKESLQELQISSCGDISDRGLTNSLMTLTSLKSLTLYDLPEVQDKKGTLNLLQQALPKCDIDFPDAHKDDPTT